MGAPVTLEKAAKGVWQFGGYGLAPMTVIETGEGLIASPATLVDYFRVRPDPKRPSWCR